MKVCPKCNQTYDDANLNFCLDDGELLMEMQTNDAPPTIMFDTPRQTNENWGGFDTGFSDQNQQNQQMYQPPFNSPQTFGQTASKDQTLPIVAIIVGSLSVVFSCCYLGVLFGPIALITGFIGMNNVNKNPDVYGGKSLAIAGMVIGGVGIAISTLLFILFLIGSVN